MRGSGWLVPTLLGCNALTGVSDLEQVDCVDCADTSVADTGRSDTGGSDMGGSDTGAADTATADFGVDSEPDDVSGDAIADARTPCTKDEDCDDGNACTSDRCAGFLMTCRHTIVDGDGDGESSTALGTCGLDCNDTNPAVFSKQTAYSTMAYTTTAGMLSYDYNCNGIADLQFTETFKCSLVGTTCVMTSPGWTTATPPTCGKPGKWATLCGKVLSSCIPGGTVDRVQGCR